MDRVIRFRVGAMLAFFGMAVLLYLLFYSAEVRDVEQFTSPVTSSSSSQMSKSIQPAPPQFFVDINQLNCSMFFPPSDADHRQYLDAYTKRNRLTLKDPIGENELLTDCNSIKKRRSYFNKESEDADFPLAYIRTVFSGYLFLEEMLSVEYTPTNVYCYSLDAKADSLFKERIRNLSNCFPNVFTVEKEYAVYSNGKNVSRSHYACLEALVSKYKQQMPWKYVFLLQNHDIPLKTNSEKTAILRLFWGANDIATNKIMPISMDDFINTTSKCESSWGAFIHKNGCFKVVTSLINIPLQTGLLMWINAPQCANYGVMKEIHSLWTSKQIEVRGTKQLIDAWIIIDGLC